jgi:hypothetical protein
MASRPFIALLLLVQCDHPVAQQDERSTSRIFLLVVIMIASPGGLGELTPPIFAITLIDVGKFNLFAQPIQLKLNRKGTQGTLVGVTPCPE